MLVSLFSITMLAKTLLFVDAPLPVIQPKVSTQQVLLYKTLPAQSTTRTKPALVESSVTAKHQPTPTPTATPTSLSPQSTRPLSELFDQYSAKYNVEKSLLVKIAQCESKMNPNAGSRYIGLFQFSEGTWIAWRKRMNENTELSLRTNAEESIKTAAYMISQGQVGAWPTCSK